MKLKKKWKRIFWLSFSIIILIIFIIILANCLISRETKYTYNDVDSIPANKVGLLLGSAKNLGDRPNYYFVHRIDATAELYKSGKIKYIVASGDNSRKEYDEASDMRDALIEKGVPDSVIYLDYAGFRTLDSVVRMNKIFGQTSFTIISQQFHNERAIYIAKQYGFDVVGYNAKDVGRKAGFKTKKRELFARVKVFVDMLINKQPKFLGEKIEIK